MSILDIAVYRNEDKPEHKEMDFQKSLIAQVDTMIRENAEHTSDGYELELDDLCHEDKLTLLRLMMEQSDHWGEELEAIVENRDLPTIKAAFFTMLKDNAQASRNGFVEVLTQALFNYYRNRLQILIQERLGAIEAQDYHDNGFYQEVDQDNGECRWGKWA